VTEVGTLRWRCASARLGFAIATSRHQAEKRSDSQPTIKHKEIHMSDAQDALATARANAEGWAAQVAELEAQAQTEPVHEGVAQGYEPSSPNSPGPKELAGQIYKRAMDDGLRDIDAMGYVIAASAGRALQGDRRFIFEEPEHHVRGIPVE
jgi:hypothetical protein